MNSALVEGIANALLYEGYMLYPYRPSALKNRQRWNFGVIAPGAYMQTECVATGADSAALEIKVRFLQLDREDAWREATEREINVSLTPIAQILARPVMQTFAFDPNLLLGTVEVAAERCGEAVFRIMVRIVNRSPAGEDSLVSTHTILSVERGSFVSSLDPPDLLRDVVSKCNNVGTWPVLVGDEGQRGMILSSPIILYDYPQIAPESSGDMFDATEMDEMLALRILTLTDDEKREMRGVEERVRRILERTESQPPEDLLRLHGRLRTEPE